MADQKTWIRLLNPDEFEADVDGFGYSRELTDADAFDRSTVCRGCGRTVQFTHVHEPVNKECPRMLGCRCPHCQTAIHKTVEN